VIAQRALLAAAVALLATLAAATPSRAATPGVVDQVVGAGVAAAATLPTQPAGDVLSALPAPAPTVRRAVEAATPSVESLKSTTERAVPPSRGAGGGPPPVAGVDPVRADPVAAATTTATEVTRRAPVGPPLKGDPSSSGLPALDQAIQTLGDTLRGIGPVGSLVQPISPLLAGVGLGELTGLVRAAPVRLVPPRGPIGSVLGRLEPLDAGNLLGASAASGPATATPPVPSAPAARLSFFHSSSAQPPAAEAGGHPGSPSPRKTPVPAAGGTATSAPGGLLFVPFLALLALAALAAPKLMRRLDAATAFLRPAPFICALERPG
jgi:hypothetical protein